jgi:sugar phosphate isomerase/epimerase
MLCSRRDAVRLGLAALPFSMGFAEAKTAPRNGVVQGVQFGVQTYSFREMLRQPGNVVDRMIAAMRELGLNQCELFEPELMPPEISVNAPWAQGSAAVMGRPLDDPDAKAKAQIYRQQVNDWHRTVSMREIAPVRAKFERAGIQILALNYSFRDDMPDADIVLGFEMAKTLGTSLITASTTLSMARRILPFAEQAGIRVAMHNHSNLHDPNQFATPESFATALAMSDLYRINLDIGHFSAAGFDPVSFIRTHHARITNLHVKDRLNNDGANVPFGQGGTPIKQVLQLLKTERYKIPAHVEYEYAGKGSCVEELAACLRYMREALA